MTLSEIVRIPFRGDEVLTVDRDGKPYVILKPAFETIGLDADRQIKKVQRQPWACTSVTAVQLPGDVQVRNVITADVRTFLMALAMIPVARVAEDVRPRLAAYQAEVADVIEAYWTKGYATNPRAVRENFFEPNTYTWDESAALIAQRFGIVLTVNELTRLLRAAGVLKQTGAPTKVYRHLFWFTGSAWNVHPHVLPQVAQKVYEAGRELQDFRFIQARLQLDGVGHPDAAKSIERKN